VQITDTALSRDLFPRDYDCLGDNDNRPVKWLALESLVDRRFSPASDAVRIYAPRLYAAMSVARDGFVLSVAQFKYISSSCAT